jgi:TPR repeat protein
MNKEISRKPLRNGICLPKGGMPMPNFSWVTCMIPDRDFAKDPHKAACWYRQSFRWYEKDAESGNDWSQYRLGVHYDKGLGVEEDKEAALHWYRLAAEQGHAISQFQLSYAYVLGEGVDRDFLKAYRWALLAETNGYKGAVALKDQIAGQLTQEELVEAHRLVDGVDAHQTFQRPHAVSGGRESGECGTYEAD